MWRRLLIVAAVLWMSPASADEVDAKRVAVVGISKGGSAVLSIAAWRRFEIFEMPPSLSYKAGVAFLAAQLK